jgi:hypothetical protein
MRLAEGRDPQPRRAPCGCRLPSRWQGSKSPPMVRGSSGTLGWCCWLSWPIVPGCQQRWIAGWVASSQVGFCPGPGRLGASPAAGRRPGRGRTQDPAVSAVARRRPDQPARPPTPVAAAAHLALGSRPRARLHPAAGTAAALLTTRHADRSRPRLAGSADAPATQPSMAAPLQTAPINPSAAPNATSGHSPATIPGRQQTNLTTHESRG